MKRTISRDTEKSHSGVTALLSLLLVCVMTPSPARPAPIPGLFNTGTDDAGRALPLGTIDPHFVLKGPASPAMVICCYDGPGPHWVCAPDPSTASWIGPLECHSLAPEGRYAYSLVVDLTGMDYTTAVIGGRLASDNSARIYLNGRDTGFRNPDQFYSLKRFRIASGFVAEVNRLDFVVVNSPPGGSDNPTGLLITDFRGAAHPVAGGDGVHTDW